MPRPISTRRANHAINAQRAIFPALRRFAVAKWLSCYGDKLIHARPTPVAFITSPPQKTDRERRKRLPFRLDGSPIEEALRFLALRMRKLQSMRSACLPLLLYCLPLWAEEASDREAVQDAIAQFEAWRVEQPFGAELGVLLGVDALKGECQRQGRPRLSVLESALRGLAECRPSLGEKSDAAAITRLRHALEQWLVSESMPSGPGLSVVAYSILHGAPNDESQVASSTASSDQPRYGRRWLRPRIVGLLALLARYQEHPTDELADAIASRLKTLASSADARPLVDAMRQYYGHPNVWLDVSEDLLDDAVEGAIDRSDPIETVILGTPVSGEGKVEAVRALAIEPRANEAILRIVVEGTIDGNTVGRKGPAQILSHTLTTFRAEKSVILTNSGLTLLPAVCQAQTRTLDSTVATNKPGLRGRILRQVARRRSLELRAAADEESSKHARQRLLKTVDDEAETLVKRLECLAVFPKWLFGETSGRSHVQVLSEHHVLRIGTILGSLGAPPSCPLCEDHRIVTLRMHETLARRLMNSLMGKGVSSLLLNQFNATAILPDAARVFGIGLTVESSSSLPIFNSGRSANFAWDIINHIFAPQLNGGRIMLRDGRWGAVLPVSLAGEWWAAEWRPHHEASNRRVHVSFCKFRPEL
jgi:hypothetical protein